MHPQDPAIHYALGDLFARQGHAAAAETHLKESLRLDPFDPQVLFALGALLDRRDRPDEALAVLKESVRLDARSAAVRVYLGTLLARSGHHAEAVIHLSVSPSTSSEPKRVTPRVSVAMLISSGPTRTSDLEKMRSSSSGAVGLSQSRSKAFP